MERARELEVVGIVRRVEREVTGIDHEVGPRRVDMVGDFVEVEGQLGQAACEMGVGDLRQSKFAHATILVGPA